MPYEYNMNYNKRFLRKLIDYERCLTHNIHFALTREKTVPAQNHNYYLMFKQPDGPLLLWRRLS